MLPGIITSIHLWGINMKGLLSRMLISPIISDSVLAMWVNTTLNCVCIFHFISGKWISRGACYLCNQASFLLLPSSFAVNAKIARDINKQKPKRNPCCSKWPQYIDFDEYSLLLLMLARSSVSSLAFDDWVWSCSFGRLIPWNLACYDASIFFSCKQNIMLCLIQS